MVFQQFEDMPPLVKAVVAGDTEEVCYLIAQKEDVNYLDSEKRSPLHVAAFCGFSRIIEVLIDNGARVNAKDTRWLTPLHRAYREWQTPLHVAAANNAVQCAENIIPLLPNNNINITDRGGRTCLHHAAYNGHHEMSELLLTNGVMVNALDKQDRRALHWAAYMGHCDVVRLLLHFGAEVGVRDRELYTPLHAAVAGGSLITAQILLDSEAAINCPNAFGNSPLHIACLNGFSNICSAASTRGAECLEVLIKEGADINPQSDDGRTPLHMTAIHGRFTRSKILMDNGAIVDCKDQNGCTPLHIAALYGHELLSGTLLTAKADPGKKGFEGRTPLHMCCLGGFVECCRKFLQAGVDIDAQDNTGKTALHLAAYKGSVECVDLLVSSGANFQLEDSHKQLPLHCAARQGHFACVLSLVAFGSRINHQDSEGSTPLHLAAARDWEGRCVEYLLRHKADPRAKDAQGFIPVHYAVAAGNVEALQLLLAAMEDKVVLHGPGMPNVTPLHLASFYGHANILQVLIPLFNDVNIKDNTGKTPLDLAAYNGQYPQDIVLLHETIKFVALTGHRQCVGQLLRGGARVGERDGVLQRTPLHAATVHGHTECVSLLLEAAENRSIVDSRDIHRRTPLMLAAAGGHSDTLIVLLRHNANPSLLDDDLHSALTRAVVFGYHSCVELLLAGRAAAAQQNRWGKTPLHLSAACGHLEGLAMLLQTTCGPALARIQDHQGLTALHWSCYNGNHKCVQYLLEQDFPGMLEGNPFSPVHCAACLQLLLDHLGSPATELQDLQGRSPLHVAALHNSVDCIKLLLANGSNLEARDTCGRTPLHAAAAGGHKAALETLLRWRADVLAKDEHQNTALHLACENRHQNCALLLLSHIDDQSSVNIPNQELKTPLHLAARQGMVAVTKTLLSRGASVEAVDNSGLTPALACAPGPHVAQCLAIILASYPSAPSMPNTIAAELKRPVVLTDSESTALESSDSASTLCSPDQGDNTNSDSDFY
ncbi:hypothetical protein B566_EDAN006154 [Ephemera danica]|nr:hypothetical protein B566_EDAN006154 [Ephemera danica]